jgi:LuxR family maltose regulon positive regulatory protein
MVRRQRLIERLLKSQSTRLVLLTAPAGYSKTTCMAEWATADKRPFAWISANHRHHDAALCVTAVVEALGEIEPVDPDILASLGSPDPSILAVTLPRLSRSFGERSEPFVLVIDDVHRLSSKEAFEVLTALIEMLPHGSQLALASRTEPPLALGRIRAHRQLTELTQGDLAMLRAESGELLGGLGLNLTPAQCDLLFERTEGWPAALSLAGIALADQADTAAAVASFAGDDRIVVDYLRDEFLGATTPAKLEFLTRTSILEELTGPLCMAALAR